MGGQQAHCKCGWQALRHHFCECPRDIAEQEYAEHLILELQNLLGPVILNV